MQTQESIVDNWYSRGNKWMQNADRGAIVHLHCEEPCTMYMGLTNVDIEEIYIENTVTKLDKCECSHM